MPFTVEDFRDLVRILEQKPEWRVELRRLVLTEELLAMPEQLAALRAETERRFQELTTETTRLSHETMRLSRELAELIKIVKRLVVDVAELKGGSLERRHRERAPAYFGERLRRVRALSSEDLDEVLESLVDRGLLSESDATDVRRSDLVVRGRRRDDGAEVYLVVEVSSGVEPGDVERAARRAEILSRSGIAALPAVAGSRITTEASGLAREKRVWQFTDGATHDTEPNSHPA